MLSGASSMRVWAGGTLGIMEMMFHSSWPDQIAPQMNPAARTARCHAAAATWGDAKTMAARKATTVDQIGNSLCMGHTFSTFMNQAGTCLQSASVSHGTGTMNAGITTEAAANAHAPRTRNRSSSDAASAARRA